MRRSTRARLAARMVMPDRKRGRRPGGEHRHGVRGLVEERAPGGGEFRVETGEEVLEDLRPPRREAVQVAGLGHAPAGDGLLWKRVPLDDRHPIEAFREHPRREQAGDAGAHDQGVAARLLGSSSGNTGPILSPRTAGRQRSASPSCA